MKKMALILLATVTGALLLTAPQARADIITNTYSYSGTPQLTWSQLYHVSQFDPGLGTLNSVAYDVNGETSGFLTVTKKSAGSQTTVNAQFGYLVGVGVPTSSGLVSLNANPVVGNVVNLGPMAQNQVRSTTTGTGTDSNLGYQLTTPEDLALYIGTGNIDITMASDWGGTVPIGAVPPGNASWTTTPSMSGNGTTGSYTVTYDYTATPEPSTYALLCISMGVVGFARKKMKKASAVIAIKAILLSRKILRLYPKPHRHGKKSEVPGPLCGNHARLNNVIGHYIGREIEEVC
jgi:hypothetical protein